MVTRSKDGPSSDTLRGAVLAANRIGGNNTIWLPAGSYHLTAQGSGDQLSVTRGSLTIIGFGGKLGNSKHPTRTIVDSDCMTRFFHVLPSAHLTLQNIELTGGGNDAEKSGAIKNEGKLILENCVIRDNGALIGAGIYNSGQLTMNHVVVSGNSCYDGLGGSGGGIYNVGTLVANDCAISNNAAAAGLSGYYSTGGLWVFSGPQPSEAGFNAGDGGGIFNAGTMTLNRCSIMDNATGRGGYAIAGYDQGADGGAGGNGGGISNAGSLRVNHCVITGNSCGDGGAGASGGPGLDGGLGWWVVGANIDGGDGGNGGSGGSGGGVFNAPGSTTQSLNSLIALNAVGSGGAAGPGYPGNTEFFNISAGTDGSSGTNGFGPDLSGGFISSGYNLIGAGDGSSGFTNGIQHDIVGNIATPANPELFRLK